MISARTETTDNAARRGWVLFDGECEICTGLVRRWENSLRRRGFVCVPLQTPWVRQKLNLSETELMLEMRVMDRSGKVAGGAAALLALARHFWWAMPLVWFARIPGIFGAIDAAYRWGAERRYCVNGACRRQGNTEQQLRRFSGRSHLAREGRAAPEAKPQR